MNGASTINLVREVSSTAKLIGWVESSVSKWKFVITVVLENMSHGHISILENRKKIGHKYNIAGFPWNTFLLDEKKNRLI